MPPGARMPRSQRQHMVNLPPTGELFRRWERQMVASVVIGIHGLANKPPSEEKKEWWKRAIIEGLKRNCAKTTDELSFDFVYWADLRYQTPISLDLNPEPYYPDEGTGHFPRIRLTNGSRCSMR